jgi:hypothetical protein
MVPLLYYASDRYIHLLYIFVAFVRIKAFNLASKLCLYDSY